MSVQSLPCMIGLSSNDVERRTTGMANIIRAISVHGKSQKTRGGRGWLVGSEARAQSCTARPCFRRSTPPETCRSLQDIETRTVLQDFGPTGRSYRIEIL
jgi:hypothetical protein